MMTTTRTPETRETLLERQWRGYEARHRDRRNLIVHAITNPIFLASNVLLLASPAVGWWGLAGLPGMAIAIALQGRAHRLEETQPEPFKGPLDVIARIVLEQWITFPRFFLSKKW